MKSSSLPALASPSLPSEYIAVSKTGGRESDDKNELAILRDLKDEVARLHLQVNDLTQIKVQQQQQLDEYRNEVSQLRAELCKRAPVEQKQKENTPNLVTQ